jgi:CelD/BcsL family acetyltransferase involved in cellulose biosynthesis
VIVPTLEADPDCAGPAGSSTRAPDGGTHATVPRRLRAERRPFDAVSRQTWDRLAGLNPWATPFSSWAFHRAWWDAYGTSAHEQTLVVVDPEATGRSSGPSDAAIVAIVPLMHRHVVEPTDAATHTSIRHGTTVALTPVAPTAKAIYFGASYHADYATILADPADMPDVAAAVVEALGAEAAPEADHPALWDVVDLRRMRHADPAAEALGVAFGRREIAEGWTLNVEREDVCPVATLPAGADIDAYLATLDKKERHEIRRKVRRAESTGPVALEPSVDPQADLEAFIDLHQRRWGADGLFPATPGGDESRVFFRRSFELFGAGGPLKLSFLTVGGRRIAASVHFETDDAILYYNAGIDPDAWPLSPGVLMVERLMRRALEIGVRRFDFLRGDEPYKYEWGAVDEPIQRLLVRRTVD